MKTHQQRFGGIERLYGANQAAVLRSAHIAVIGVGGVGSWAAESLARSGIGTISLVDLDEICITNTNRQIHAETNTVGMAKTTAMRNRILAINPECQVIEESCFVTPSSCQKLLENGYDCIVDAIDDRKNKCLLLAECKRRKIRVVTTGGAGGRKDPSAIRVADITKSYNDPLMARVRKKLRNDYGFSRNKKRSWGIPCIFSPEPVVYPGENGSVCSTRPEGSELKLDCDSGYGTASFVTGTFGFMAAAKAIELVLKQSEPPV
ncbi:MAG: tRNA cyclic N6-threonylcarbamoyladenosine(37) synthase TcdA [Verrucomicrobiae bacterium]|nr:tRNA cyclic N6-threonylcarbamoyladenosine(37) synthase TcdA [Verrucomicrobiae bacterium]